MDLREGEKATETKTKCSTFLRIVGRDRIGMNEWIIISLLQSKAKEISSESLSEVAFIFHPLVVGDEYSTMRLCLTMFNF